MDPSRAHVILPTNATSAANPLAATIPTTIARDTVVQTNRPGEVPEYREIKTTEQILQPILLEKPAPTKMTTKTTTTVVEEKPIVLEPNIKTTTTIVEEVPTSTDYVIKRAEEFKPVAVVSDVTSVNDPNNRIVGTTASGSLTTPGKVVGDLEAVVSERHETTVAEPVTKKVVKTVTTTTNQ